MPAKHGKWPLDIQPKYGKHILNKENDTLVY